MPSVFVFGGEERREKDAAEQDTPSAMGPLPPDEDRLFDAMLEKQVTAGQLGWQLRRLVLTNNALIFARPGVPHYALTCATETDRSVPFEMDATLRRIIRADHADEAPMSMHIESRLSAESLTHVRTNQAKT